VPLVLPSLICPFITRAKLDRRLKSKILATLPRLDRPQADNPPAGSGQ
jgi:hypothetical protein